MHAALDATRVSAIDDGFASNYKGYPTAGTFLNKSVRHAVNIPETLKQFEARFTGGEIFKSATEICGLDLYPVVASENVSGGAAAPTYDSGRTSIKNFWSTRRLTGDNLREQPYATLYQNLTTQSNTFTVHVWAQAIKKAPGTPADQMTDRDSVTGEYRVSYSIERFIDPANPALPDFADTSQPDASSFYQFRVNNTKQFQP